MLIQNLPKLNVLGLIKPMIQVFGVSQEIMITPLLPKIQIETFAQPKLQRNS